MKRATWSMAGSVSKYLAGSFTPTPGRRSRNCCGRTSRVTAAVELLDVRKSYGGYAAVDGISFAIPPAHIFGLLGPNGAGKTSTIRMMIGITSPDSGAVRLFGEPLHRRVLHRVGYLPKNAAFDATLRVTPNWDFS